MSIYHWKCDRCDTFAEDEDPAKIDSFSRSHYKIHHPLYYTDDPKQYQQDFYKRVAKAPEIDPKPVSDRIGGQACEDRFSKSQGDSGRLCAYGCGRSSYRTGAGCIESGCMDYPG